MQLILIRLRRYNGPFCLSQLLHVASFFLSKLILVNVNRVLNGRSEELRVGQSHVIAGDAHCLPFGSRRDHLP